MAKKDAKSRRRRQSKKNPPAEGTQRRMFGHECVYLPGHAIAPASGWARVSRVAVYDRLEGADPACGGCGAQLDWAAPYGDDLYPCVKPEWGAGGVVACRACLVGVAEFARAGVPSPTSLLWAQAEDVCGPRGHAVSRGPQGGPLVAAHGDGDDDYALGRLHEAERRLRSVWDGSESDARLFVAAAHLLALRARRPSS